MHHVSVRRKTSHCDQDRSAQTRSCLPTLRLEADTGLVRELPMLQNTDQSGSLALITWPTTTGLV